MESPGLLFQSHFVVAIPRRHIGEDDLIALAEPAQNHDVAYRTAAELHLHALGVAPTVDKAEQTDGTVLLPQRGTADIQHVVESFELNRSVDAQIGSGT